MSTKPQPPAPNGTCAQCGAQLQPGARFCRACGSPRADLASGGPPPGDASAPQGRLGACPGCGHANPPGTKFCRRCGADLASPPPAPGGSPTPAGPSDRSAPVSDEAERVEWRRWARIAGVAAILLVAVGVAALLLSGGGGDGSDSQSQTEPAAAPSTPSQSQAEAGLEGVAPDTSPPASAAASRTAILGVLHEYENAYSEASVAAMSPLITGDVVRQGLQAGGCSTETGKRAVLSAYKSQFSRNGPVLYRLVELGVGDVQLQGEDEARVETEYSIAAADNSGPVGFALVDPGDGWQIAEVDATCNPG